MGLLAATLASGTATAAPVYYTFEGLTSGGSDSAGIIADAGLSLYGSPVSYIWLVDTEAPASYTRGTGLTYSWSLEPYYYADLLSAPPIQNKNGGYAPYQTVDHISEYNYGYSPSNTALYAGSNTNFTHFVVDSSPSNWVVGFSATASTRAYDELGNASFIYSTLTLSSISDTAPGAASASVPEPGTLLLLGSGMAGLGIMRRFRNRKA